MAVLDTLTLLLGQRTHISHVHRPQYRFHISSCFGVIEDGIIPKNFWSGTYGSASLLPNGRVVFNIGGNKYRLIVLIRYDKQMVFVRFVGTHAVYDRIDAE